MMTDDPLSRMAELQSGPVSEVPDPSATRRKDARESKGTPSREFNDERKRRTSEADAIIEKTRDRKSYNRLVDERSQFRRPSDILDVKTGRALEEKPAQREDTRLAPSGPSGITVHRTPAITGGQRYRTEKGIVIRAADEQAQRMQMRMAERSGRSRQADDPSFQSRVLDAVARGMPEIAAMSWSYAGKSMPPAGYSPQVNMYGAGVKWSEGSVGYDFRTDGKIFVGGSEVGVAPAFSTFSGTDDDLWVKVFFDASTAIVTTTQPFSTDEYEVYRIRAGGKNVQFGDIHESRS